LADQPSRKSDNGKGPLPKGWPRAGGKRRSGLDPKRQLILVGLAVGGLAVGYMLGSVTKPHPTPDPAPAPTVAEAPPVTAAEPAPEATPEATPEPAKEPEAAAVVEAKPTPDPNPDPKPAAKSIPKPKPKMAAPTKKPAKKRAPPAHARHDYKGKPAVVVVIDDLGVDQRRSARMTTLTGPLTLSYLSYADNLAAQIAKGRAAGHEIMMHVSMEPESLEVDPGPNFLLTGLPPAELKRSLNWNLDQFTGYVGINNHMGSRFTKDADGMRIVMAEVKRRGVFFLDSLTSQRSVGARMATEAGVPHLVRDIFIDHEDDRAAIRRQLRAMERLARRQGIAIGIAHPRDGSLAELKPWLAGLADKGIRIITASQALKETRAETTEHAATGDPQEGG